jgi:hypothetical protein
VIFYYKFLCVGLLLWEFLLVILLVFTLVSFFLNNHSIVSLLLCSEFLVIVLFCLFTNTAVLANINFFFGIALSFLILGGLEVALTLMLLVA